MKQFCIALLTVLWVGLGTITHAQSTTLEEAQKLAKKENKTILLSFSGSDWCRSCILLKKTILSTEAFEKFADQNLIVVEADFPRSKKHQLSKEQTAYNEKLAVKYNPQGQFPRIVLLDADLKVLGKTGYKKISPEAYVDHIQSIITQ